MAKMRKVQVVNGFGKFTGPNTLEVEGADGKTTVTFDNAIIAAGSRPVKLPFIPMTTPRMGLYRCAGTTTVPGKLLVIGGGIIGLEMGTVYSSLGSGSTWWNLPTSWYRLPTKTSSRSTPSALPRNSTSCWRPRSPPLKPVKTACTSPTKASTPPAEPVRYDNVLVAVGRVPNGKMLDAEKAGVAVNERGFIEVDKQLRTNVAAHPRHRRHRRSADAGHKGVHEGHVAAEVIAGKKHYFDPKVIPSIAYTEPEMAWVGLTEKEAKQQGLNFEVATFPWAASRRAIASDCSNGMTKLIFDKESAASSVVPSWVPTAVNCWEIGLAIEMGADAEDIALTIHAHPTLHESVGLAAEVFEGSITDLPNAKARRKNNLLPVS